MRTIIQHIRNKRTKEPQATLVAVEHEGGIRIGWSKYHKREELKSFTKRRGVEIATGRAEKGLDPWLNVPDVIKWKIPGFVVRVEKAFSKRVTNLI